MAVIGEAFIEIKPKADGFEQQAEQQVGGPMKRVIAGVGAALAAGAVLNFGKSAFDAAIESQKIAAQTEAVIKSTGEAAGLSATQIGDMAEALSRKNTVDDEAIQSAQNMLLTFTNIGGNDGIFERTTQAAIDMAAALGQDPTAAAMQLGKALNDPADGLSKLSRAGIQFTDQQKEQIKTMQESGDIAGAQAIMLAELERQFGGSAAAQATATDRMNIALGNLQEDIGALLIPAFEGFATLVSDHVVPGLQRFGQFVGAEVVPRIERLAEVIGDRVAPYIDTLVLGVQALVAAFQDGDVTSDGFVGVMERIGVAVRELADEWMPRLRTALQFVTDNWQYFAAGALVVLSPLAAVVAGLVLAYQRSETFRDVLRAVADFVVNEVAPRIEEFAQTVVETWEDLVRWTEEHWDAISEAVGHVIVAIRVVIETGLDVIAQLWDRWGGRIFSIVRVAIDNVRAYVELIVDIIRNVIELVVNLINGEWGAAWDNVVAIVQSVVDYIVTMVGNIGEVIQNLLAIVVDTVWQLFQGMWDLLLAAGQAGLDALVNLLQSMLERYVQFWMDLPGRITGALGDLGGFIWAAIVGGLEALAGQFVSLLERVVTLWVELPGRVVSALGDLGGFIWNAITGGLEALWGFIRTGIENNITFWSEFPGKVINAIGDIGGAVWNAISGGMTTLLNNVTGIVSDVVAEFTALPGKIAGIAGSVASAAASIGSSIIEGMRNGLTGVGGLAMDFASAFADAVKDVINSEVIDRINSALEFTIPGPGFLPDVHLDAPDIPRLHGGGIVAGPSGSEHVRTLLAGEGVFTRDQMAALSGLIADRGARPESTSVVVNIGSVGGTLADAERVASLTGSAVARVLTRRHLSVDVRGAR